MKVLKIFRKYHNRLKKIFKKLMFTTRCNKDTLFAFIDFYIINYPTSVNFNYTWSFGDLALILSNI